MGVGILNVLAPLVGVLLGAFVVHWSTARRDRNQRKFEATALAGMLAAEIDATIRHAENRNYETFYRQILKQFESGDFSARPSIRGMNDKLPDILAANIDRLGLLGPKLCYDVVSWYTGLQSIKIDLVDLGMGNVLQDERAPLLREVLRIWDDELKKKAPTLIDNLRRIDQTQY